MYVFYSVLNFFATLFLTFFVYTFSPFFSFLSSPIPIPIHQGGGGHSYHSTKIIPIYVPQHQQPYHINVHGGMGGYGGVGGSGGYGGMGGYGNHYDKICYVFKRQTF